MAKIGGRPINAKKMPKRSDLGLELIRKLSQEGLRIFSIDRARDFAMQVGIKDAYLAEALYHLRQTGWLVALRRGLYAISPLLPGVPPAHEFEIAMALVTPAAISHWSALHHHGLTEQAPRRIFVLTTTGTSLPRVRKGSTAARPYTIGGFEYQFIQVKPERYFGIEKGWIAEAQVMMTDPERTLLDGLSAPQYCGDFAEVLHAFEVRASHLDVRRVIDYAKRLDAATAKRLGWVLERQGTAASQLQPLLDVSVKGFSRLDPTGPRQGSYNKRWMVQENLPGRVPA